MSKRVTAIIVASGKGRRMGEELPKKYLPIDGVPILTHTLRVFLNCTSVHRIVLVVPESDLEYCQRNIITSSEAKTIDLVAGGAKRQDSVYNGLKAAGSLNCDLAVIHDGVRPFISVDLIETCIRAAGRTHACIAAVPVGDTLKEVDAQECIVRTVDRDRLWLAQTPQVFDYALITKAHEAARKAHVYDTDDAALVERLGIAVKIISGSRLNIKITHPEDLTLAVALLTAMPR